MNEDGFIPPHGNYQELLCYQKGEVIYDITFRFCHKFLKCGDRTIDQMVQAARSGKQNISEGSEFSGTSKEVEIKMINSARSSLEELSLDYKDYLRVRNLRKWEEDDKEAIYVRKLGRKPNLTYEDVRKFVETRSDEVIANIALCFIFQNTYLLDQLKYRLERDFLKEGGLRERMTRARLNVRNNSNHKPHPPH